MQISVSSRSWYAILCDTMSTACHTRQARCLHAVQLRGVGGAGLGRVGGLVHLSRTTDRNLTAPPAVYTLLLRPFRAGIMRVGDLPRPGCLNNCRCTTAKKTPHEKIVVTRRILHFSISKCSSVQKLLFFLHVWKRDPTHFFWLEVFWGAVGWPWAALGLPGRVLISRPRGGVWQWGSGNGVWHWGSSDMRGMSVYGIGVATMGGGEVGYTPTPCVDAGTLHQNRWPEKIRRVPYTKKDGPKKYVGLRFPKCKKTAVFEHLKMGK